MMLGDDREIGATWFMGERVRGNPPTHRGNGANTLRARDAGVPVQAQRKTMASENEVRDRAHGGRRAPGAAPSQASSCGGFLTA
jgi:hypothetical protein